MFFDNFVLQCDIDSTVEKGISIEYPYNFGLPLGNSAFVMVWLEFDLLVRTIVQSKGFKRFTFYFDFCGVSQSKYLL